MTSTDILISLQQLIALTNTGLAFSQNQFDQERYEAIHLQLDHLLNQVSSLDQTEITELLKPTNAYVTPLVDTRAVLIHHHKLCLVQDRHSQEWSLPDGFAEVGLSAKENIIKEVYEETGYHVLVKRLLAIYETNRHQPQSKHFYKLIFECDIIDGEFKPNLEVSQLDFFDCHQLPALSLKRNTKVQLQQCFDVAIHQKQTIID